MNYNIYEFKTNYEKLQFEFDTAVFESNVAYLNDNSLQKVDIKPIYETLDMFKNTLTDLNSNVKQISLVDIDKFALAWKKCYKTFQARKFDSMYMNASIYVGNVSLKYIDDYIKKSSSAIDKYINNKEYENNIITNDYLTGSMAAITKKRIEGSISMVELYLTDPEADSDVLLDNVVDVLNSSIPSTVASLNKTLASFENTIGQDLRNLIKKVNVIQDLDLNATDIGNRNLRSVWYNVIKNICGLVRWMIYRLIEIARSINLFIHQIDILNSKFVEILKAVQTTIESASFDFDEGSLLDKFLQGDVSDLSAIVCEMLDNEKVSVYVKHLPEETISVDKYLDKPYVKSVDNLDLIYDMNPYVEVLGSINHIQDSIKVINEMIKDITSTYNEIMDESNIILNPDVYYSDVIDKIVDVSIYKSDDLDDIYDKSKIVEELSAFPNNIAVISRFVNNTFININKLLPDNIENDDDNIVVDDISKFMLDYIEVFKKFAGKILSNFIKRIKLCDEMISEESVIDMTTSDDGEVINSTEDEIDFLEMAYESSYNTLLDFNELVFMEMEKQFYADRMLNLRGVEIIFEDDQNNSTSPTVTDNSGGGNGIGSKLANFSNNMKDNMKNFIKAIIAKFLEVINKIKARDVKWINDNKQNLMNRSYDGVTLNILPYKNIEPNILTQDIQKLANNVKGLNPQALQNIQSKEDMYKKILPFIQGGIQEKNGSLGEQLTAYYKTKSFKQEMTTLNNNDVKQFVSKALTYVNDYSNNYSKQLSQYLDNLASAVDNKLTSLGGTNGTSTNQNNNTNNNQNNTENKNTESNISEKGGWVSNICKTFSGAALNASRDRYNDYMKVLKSLASNAAPATNNNNQNNNENENKK